MFPLSHRLKYLAWRLSGAERPITLRMKSGALLPMRPLKHRDYGTAYDVFVIQPYNVDLQDPRVIVDLGATLGMRLSILRRDIRMPVFTRLSPIRCITAWCKN